MDHFIFLIHPCCYEVLTPQQVEQDNLYLYVELEEKIKARWLASLAEKPKDTLFVQLGGPEYFWQAAKEHLGETYACYLRTPFSQEAGLADYFCRLGDEIKAHMAANDLQFDAATATAELWGESFEGCVPGYGGAFAQHLGLQKAPRMLFEMTVYDSRFLYGARRMETVAVVNSDVEAWLFECHDGTGAATFQARNTAQWIDQRQVRLQLDNHRIQVCNKQGHTLWPPEPWAKGMAEGVHEYGMTLAEANWRWVRSVGMRYDEFKEVIRGARVVAVE